MKESKKYSILGYFRYFYNLLGNKMYILLALNAIAGILDGIGLMMFIPLLGASTGALNIDLGQLQFIFDSLEKIGFEITLINVLILMIIVFVLKGLVQFYHSTFSIKTRQFTIREVRFKLIDKLHHLTYLGYSKADPGTIQNAMLRETTRLMISMNQYLTSLQSLIILFIYVFLAFMANYKFTMLILVGGAFSSVIYFIINRLTLKRSRESLKITVRFNKYIIQVLKNFKYLKSTNLFSNYKLVLKEAIADFEHKQFEIGKLNAILSNIKEPLVVIVMSVVMIIYVYFFKQSLSGVLLSLLLFYRALNSLMSIQTSWNTFLKESVSIEEVDKLTEYFNSFADPVQSSKEIDSIRDIALDNVSFGYDDSRLLKNISFSIPENNTIAFVGESGSGKTTLVNIIIGLIAPNSGRLLVNGTALDSECLHAYRDKIGYITQEPAIFQDTFFNNVTFWDEKTEENLAKFNRCMELVHLTPLINSLELKEDAPLGNQGILISGGQKQRVSIARELYRDVDVLVMDEATSALDTETENIIKKNIDALHGNYTMIIIAHRLSTIKNADCVYLIKEGNIEDHGTYEDLYNSSITFKKMVDLQGL